MNERGTRGTGRRVDDRHGLTGPDAVAAAHHLRAEGLMILAMRLRERGQLDAARETSLRAARAEEQAFRTTVNEWLVRQNFALSSLSLYSQAEDLPSVRRLAAEILRKDSLRPIHGRVRVTLAEAIYRTLPGNS